MRCPVLPRRLKLSVSSGLHAPTIHNMCSRRLQRYAIVCSLSLEISVKPSLLSPGICWTGKRFCSLHVFVLSFCLILLEITVARVGALTNRSRVCAGRSGFFLTGSFPHPAGPTPPFCQRAGVLVPPGRPRPACNPALLLLQPKRPGLVSYAFQCSPPPSPIYSILFRRSELLQCHILLGMQAQVAIKRLSLSACTLLLLLAYFSFRRFYSFPDQELTALDYWRSA